MRTRWAAAVAVLLLTTALAGCDGSEKADGEATASGSASTTPSVTASGSESATNPPSPTVIPASGETLTLKDFTITMPAGWKVKQESDGGSAIERDGTTFGNILVHSFPRIGIDSLDSFVTAYVKSLNHDGNQLKRLDNRTIDGVEGYVVQGTDPLGDFTYEYGTFSDDQEIHIAFYYDTKDNPDADPFAVIEPVLATLTWT